MKTIGFIGLGDMGMPMAKNLLKAGFSVKGFDLRGDRLENFCVAGGAAATSVADAARGMDILFAMVMNGEQVISVCKDIKDVFPAGSTFFITATIGPWYVKDAAELLSGTGINIIDMPVSGGRFGAEDGTLSLMIAGSDEVIDKKQDILNAIGQKLYRVGPHLGDGQTVKGCIQALQAASYEGLFEAMVLAEKSGLDLTMFSKVLNESIIGSAITRNTTQKIIDRQFVGTGSHIATLLKDVSISVEMGKRMGVPMYCANVAREVLQAGINVMPEGDNWSVVKMLEAQSGIKRDD